jgi:uncharacterized protein YggE
MAKQFWMPACLIAIIVAALPLASPAQQAEPPKGITISSTGVVKAIPDLCVIILEVRATSPLAKDALQECTQRVADVSAKLRQLGVKDDGFRFSGIQYSPAGGGRVIYPGGQRSTGFDVYQVLRVQIKEPSPAKAAEISARVSSLLDDLSKAGANVISPAISQMSMGGSSGVIFAVSEPDKYEKQAYDAAIERARAAAEEIAKKLGVKIAGINSVNTGMQSGVIRNPYSTDTLEFPYYSTSPDEISIRSTVSVSFAIK